MQTERARTETLHLRLARLRSIPINFGYNALTGEYEDLVKAGVLDPTKVVRTALTNAGSIAALMLTTEALVVDITEEKKGSPAGGPAGMGDMY